MTFPVEKTGELQVEHTNAMTTIDTNIKDADILHAQDLAEQLQNGTFRAEKDLVRKLDWRILPCCWVLYLLGFLDRANVGYVGTLILLIESECYADP